MKGEIELYNISFLILKVELHFNTKWCNISERLLKPWHICIVSVSYVLCNYFIL